MRVFILTTRGYYTAGMKCDRDEVPLGQDVTIWVQVCSLFASSSLLITLITLGSWIKGGLVGRWENTAVTREKGYGLISLKWQNIKLTLWKNWTLITIGNKHNPGGVYRYESHTGMTCDFIACLRVRLSFWFYLWFHMAWCTLFQSTPGVCFVPKWVAIPRLRDTNVHFCYRKQDELIPVWVIPTWDLELASWKRIESDKRELGWNRYTWYQYHVNTPPPKLPRLLGDTELAQDFVRLLPP